ncbi:MAG: 16S rRNA (guanine(527)-N(7))-methyltransferase RsmG [Alphaproteobacteria bacterium]|nr:16S rRNA (guanine(527)-N(7))-methyltransferase RsmG [Alphaproteobacteria bacterium]
MSAKLQPEIRARLQLYHDLLLKWQKAVNLVSLATISDAWNRHFEDSLQLLDMIPENAKTLIDIGSGAGFPGLVLAIARPDLEVHLVESDQKKGTFLLTVSRETGAKNVHVHSERIESALPRLQGDVVTARALAPLGKLLTLTQPQWERADRPATLMLLKGEEWQKEVTLASQDHVFQVADYPSKTNPDAAILCITGVAPRKTA